MADYNVFLVVFLFTLKCVYGKDCSDIENIVNCNDCSKCGGYWCEKPEPWQTHCSRKPHYKCGDEWIDQGVVLNITKNSKSPRNIDRVITVGIPHRIPIKYSSPDKINIKIEGSRNFSAILSKANCETADDCVQVIESMAGLEFCAKNDIMTELQSVEVVISADNIEEEFRIKYQTSCRCECSKNIVKNSGFCNGHGKYSCGACSCEGKWAGENCQTECFDRGDVQNSNCYTDGVKCGGNGYCNSCGTCECIRDPRIDGSQYLNEDTQCIDICSQINNACYQCFHNFTVGKCFEQCNGMNGFSLMRQHYNKSLLEELFDEHRHVWMQCKGHFYDCDTEYAAKGAGNDMTVMLIKSCHGNSAGIFSTNNVKVPIILAIVLAVVALMAAAAYVVWQKRVGPMHESSAQIEHLDGEGVVGSNPFYKNPTSYFRNPTYGKL